jgi:uncharacterized protein YjbI with pentapeptide repeats
MAVGDLSADERWLVDEVEAGRPASFPAAGDKPEIRASVLRGLALSVSRPQGMDVRHARIRGVFDLGFAEITGPLAMLSCEFDDVVRLDNALLVNVDLRGSSFPAIRASSAEIKHNLILQGCPAGTVRLVGARIGGDLDLRSASLSGAEGMALVADRSTIGGAFLAHGDFRATGEVRLVRSTITGVVNLNGATCVHAGRTAINMDGARLNGGMFCAEGFRAEGQVRLAGATVERVLELSGGTFTNLGGTALMVDAARVEGSVLCRTGFIAAGQASFSGASIAGLLDLSGGSFANPGKLAVDLTEAKVGHLRLTAVGKGSSGEFNLSRTHIGSLEDAPQAWVPFSPVSLLGCTYDHANDDGWNARSRLSWLEKDPAYRAQSYEQLAKALRAQGHETEARAVMVAKYRRRRDSQEWHRKLLGYVFDGLLAYGYRPLQRTLPALLVLYLLGAALLLPQARDAGAVIATRTPVTAPSGQPDAADPETSQPVEPSGPSSASGAIAAGSECPANYPCFSSWRYAADVVIPLINTRQTEYWTVTAATPAGQRAVWYNTAAAALGWFLTTAAALGFTGLIRRD